MEGAMGLQWWRSLPPGVCSPSAIFYAWAHLERMLRAQCPTFVFVCYVPWRRTLVPADHVPLHNCARCIALAAHYGGPLHACVLLGPGVHATAVHCSGAAAVRATFMDGQFSWQYKGRRVYADAHAAPRASHLASTAAPRD